MDEFFTSLSKTWGVDFFVVTSVGGNAVTLTQGIKKTFKWQGWPVVALCSALCFLLSAGSWVFIARKMPGHADWLHFFAVMVIATLWGILSGRWQSIMPDNRGETPENPDGLIAPDPETETRRPNSGYTPVDNGLADEAPKGNL